MTGTPIPVLFFGGRDTEASVLETNNGFQDNGAAYVPLAKSNPIAPAGASGECIFTNVYITLTHSMPVDIRVTPIVDFIALDGTGGQPDERLIFSLPDLTPDRLTERFEMGLSLPFPLQGTERVRNALRGAWFQRQYQATNGLRVGDFIFDYTVIQDVVGRELVPVANT